MDVFGSVTFFISVKQATVAKIQTILFDTFACFVPHKSQLMFIEIYIFSLRGENIWIENSMYEPTLCVCSHPSNHKNVVENTFINEPKMLFLENQTRVHSVQCVFKPCIVLLSMNFPLFFPL